MTRHYNIELNKMLKKMSVHLKLPKVFAVPRDSGRLFFLTTLLTNDDDVRLLLLLLLLQQCCCHTYQAVSGRSPWPF